MDKPFRILTLFLVLALPAAWALAPVRAQGLDTPTPELVETSQPIPSPADIINAVNSLRAASGLNVLAVHPVLMEVAALQANALAVSEGTVGHERPCGMTLGQQLLSLGYPLWGDLSQDGYRSENWVAAGTMEQIMGFWQSDAEHMNTMVSDFRSDIGAAVAVSDQIYVVLETALSTPTKRMQITAFDILTGIPVTQTVCAGYYDGSISQYSVPVAVNTARPDGDVVHEVKYGQTLWAIAELYHVHVDDIKHLNGLVDDTVVPGWKLLVQKGATQPAPIPPTSAAQPLSTDSGYPTAVPFHTSTPSVTVTVPAVPVGAALQQNGTVVVALMIAFAVLLAGMLGFRKPPNDS